MTLLRTRWSAIGAAVAVTLGAGGIGLVSATSPSDAAALVPITPCRIADTRSVPEFNTGPRNTPIGAEDTLTISAHGDNGDCTGIPSTATGLSLNVTALGATAPTFLTIWAAGAAQPDASSLNPGPGQPPTPNGVTTRLSPDGRFNIYNLAGVVDAIIDVNGYYTDHRHDDRYYTKSQVDANIAAGAGSEPPGLFDRTVVVNGGGTNAENGAALRAAVDEVAAESPTASDRWTLFLEPGVFELTSGLRIPDHVTLTGSGIEATTISSPAGDPGSPTTLQFGIGELRHLEVRGDNQFTLVGSNGSLRITAARIDIGGTSGVPIAVRLSNGPHTITDTEIDVRATTNGAAVDTTEGVIDIVDSTLTAVSGSSVELVAMSASDVNIDRSTLEGTAIGVFSCCSAAPGTLTVRQSVIDVDRPAAIANFGPLDATVLTSTVITRSGSDLANFSAGGSFSATNSTLAGGIVTAAGESCIATATAGSFLAAGCP